MIRSMDVRTFTLALFELAEAAFLSISADIPGEYWARENFLREMPDKWTLSFAVYDGPPIAYVILSRPEPHRVHLHRLMVTQDRRSGGLGAQMMAEMVRRAAGATLITLKTLCPRAIAFYSRHGFLPAGESNGYLVMERKL